MSSMPEAASHHHQIGKLAADIERLEEGLARQRGDLSSLQYIPPEVADRLPEDMRGPYTGPDAPPGQVLMVHERLDQVFHATFEHYAETATSDLRDFTEMRNLTSLRTFIALHPVLTYFVVVVNLVSSLHCKLPGGTKELDELVACMCILKP